MSSLFTLPYEASLEFMAAFTAFPFISRGASPLLIAF
jgi:hypothetical protein